MTTDAETMKPQGRWLGDTPEHWDVRRLKYLLRERDSRSLTGDGQLLSVSQYTGVTERREAGEGQPNARAASLAGYKRVEPDELVVNIMLAWNGSLGVSRYQGITSPAYCVYRFGREAHPWYYHYLLRSPAYKARIKAVSTGVVDSRLRLYTDDLYELLVPVPPRDEQQSIVRFLDHADRRIGRAIRAKQKLIGLLNEQKQAVIHRAVTRGLDPDVSLRPSGVRWLGDVPAAWRVTRMRHVLADRIRNGLYKGPDHHDLDGTPMIQMGEAFAAPVIQMTATDRVRLTDDERKRWLLAPGDLLFARRSLVFEGSGKCSLVGDLPEPHVFESSLIRARPNTRLVSPEYLWRFLGSWFSRSQVLSVTKQVTISGIDGQQLKELAVLIPPKDEQRPILDAVARWSGPLDAGMRAAQDEADRLREYGTRLIADVVTGRLDVRSAAARLPDEANATEPIELVDVEQSDDAAGENLEVLEA